MARSTSLASRLSRPLRIVLILVALALLGLLALVGLLTLTKGTPIDNVRTLSGEAVPSVRDPIFPYTIELFTGSQLVPRNRVELLLNGDGTYPALWSDLRSARRAITVQLYYAQPGAVADTMLAILTERARAGVTVLALFDAFGAGPLGDAYLDRLAAAGVRTAWLRPIAWYTLHKASKRSHVRSIVVDGRVGYTGGFGLADYWLGGGRAPDEWRETNVRFWGPAVAQLQAAFADGWSEATGELITGDNFFPPCSYAFVCTADGEVLAVTPLANDESWTRQERERTRPGPARADTGAAAATASLSDSARRLQREAPGSAQPPPVRPEPEYASEAALLHTVPGFGSTAAERLLALSIAGARRTLYITNSYFVPDDDFRGLLVEAARRGVDVRVLTAGDSTDIQTTLLAGRARYEALLRGGVRIYEYQPTMMHAKTIVVDGRWSLVGSLNFDNRSLALNNESTLLTLDPAIAEQLETIFLADLPYAREVTLEAHLARGWWARTKEWGASLLSRVL